MSSITLCATLSLLPFLHADSPVEVDAELLERAAGRWGKHLVPVAFWFKRSDGDDPSGMSASRSRRTSFVPRGTGMETPYSEKRPLELAGLAVDAHTIWIPDPRFESRFVAKVEVGSPPAPARVRGTCLGAAVWVIRAEAPIAGIEPIDFKGDASEPGRLVGLASTFSGGGWTHAAAPVGSRFHKRGDSLWLETTPGALILDGELDPVGYTGSGKLGLESAPDLWRGKDLAADTVLDFDILSPSNEALARKADAWSLTVRGFFRREIESEESPFRRFRMQTFREDDESANEFMTSGYAVGPRTVLVNEALSREAALRLERIVVVVAGEERPARFLGAFRRFNACLVELEGDELKESMDLSADAPFAVGEPIVAVTADHSTRARRTLVSFNRVTGIERGYRGILEPVLQHFPRPGSLALRAADMSLKGVVVEVRRESSDDDPRGSRFGGIDLRLMAAGEIKALLAEGKAAMDPRLEPRTSEREKDMVWLGVDFQALTPELAKENGVELATRGGTLGVIVLHVHEGSPANRLGMTPGDILLGLRDEEEPEPWEVTARDGFAREDMFDLQALDEVPEDVREEFLARAGPPWRSPRNAISEKLTRIGEGKRVEVSYLHEGKEVKSTITLEVGPPDFENARRFEAKDLGLTVKDLTYEVRGYYRLAPDAPGVVVAKVERGGKAAIAKVGPFEVLVSVNGQPVRNVDEAASALEAAEKKEDGAGGLELRLERLGKSRLVRIR
jgi:hypothetical protein